MVKLPTRLSLRRRKMGDTHGKASRTPTMTKRLGANWLWEMLKQAPDQQETPQERAKFIVCAVAATGPTSFTKEIIQAIATLLSVTN